MKPVLLILACVNLVAADLPVTGISHVGFRVADLEKTRAFYTGVLGFQEAFGQKDAAGKTTLAVFKINEDEFIECSPGIPPSGDRFTHIAFLTAKLEALRTALETLGLNPPEIRTGRDRTRNVSIKDPDGQRVEFVEYEPDSMQAQARGKFADDRRISTQLRKVGIAVAAQDREATYFRDTLGLMTYVELLPQAAPARMYFEVPNLKQAMQTLRTRGLTNSANIQDPDGTPIELVSAPR